MQRLDIFTAFTPHSWSVSGVEQAIGQEGRMPSDFDAMGQDWTCAPSFSDGVTAAEIW